jgi:hypothetical protein
MLAKARVVMMEARIRKIREPEAHLWARVEKHLIVGSKHLNYLNFKNAAIIIKNKEHLNPDRKGLEQLLVLKKI